MFQQLLVAIARGCSTGSWLWFALDGTHCAPPGVCVMPYSTRAPRLAFATGGSVVIRRHRPSGYVRCDPANSNDTPGQSALNRGHQVSKTKMNAPKKNKKKKKKKNCGIFPDTIWRLRDAGARSGAVSLSYRVRLHTVCLCVSQLSPPHLLRVFATSRRRNSMTEANFGICGKFPVTIWRLRDAWARSGAVSRSHRVRLHAACLSISQLSPPHLLRVFATSRRRNSMTEADFGICQKFSVTI
jgi:hypothetical protein